jgi:hypothetical protein
MLKSFSMVRFTALLIVLFLSPCLFAADQATEVDNKAYWLCKHRKEVRTIRVQIDDKGICSTFYSKAGDEKRVGSGKNHDSCFNFLNSIKANLEKSNWNCRDIADTKITATAE